MRRPVVDNIPTWRISVRKQWIANGIISSRNNRNKKIYYTRERLVITQNMKGTTSVSTFFAFVFLIKDFEDGYIKNI